MTAFFRNEYDLFHEIMKGSREFMSKTMLSLDVVGRNDLQDDVKDAIIEIVSSKSFGDASDALSSLLAMFEDAFGVYTKIEKRD